MLSTRSKRAALVIVAFVVMLVTFFKVPPLFAVIGVFLPWILGIVVFGVFVLDWIQQADEDYDEAQAALDKRHARK